MIIRRIILVLILCSTISILLQGQDDPKKSSRILNSLSENQVRAYFSDHIGFLYESQDFSALDNAVNRLDSLGYSSAADIGYFLLNDNNYFVEKLNALNTNAAGCIYDQVSGRISNCTVISSEISLERAQTYGQIMAETGNRYLIEKNYELKEVPTAISYAFEQLHSFLAGELDVFPSEAIEIDLDLVNSGQLSSPNPSPNELTPYIFFENQVTCISEAGIPIPLPAGAMVQFYPSSDTKASMLKQFTYKEGGEDDYSHVYVPLTYNERSNYEGKLAGYGYCSKRAPLTGVCIEYTRYSYENFVSDDESTPNAPPYIENKPIDITRGLIISCEEGKYTSKYKTQTLGFRVPYPDYSDPSSSSDWNSDHEGGNYYCVGDKTTASDIFSNYESSLINWDPYLGQTVSVNQSNNRSGNHSCIIDKLVNQSQVIQAIETGSYYLTKLEDESIAVIAIVGGKQYCQIQDPNDGTTGYMMYHPSAGWVYVDSYVEDFVGDAFNTLIHYGEFLAISTFVIANIAVGNVAATWAISVYSSSSYAALLATAAVDVAFASAEAGVVLFVTDDKEKFKQTLLTGVLYAGIGSGVEFLGMRVIKSWNVFKYGPEIGNAAKGFDAVVEFTVNGQKVRKSLRQFEKKLLDPDGLGWSKARVKILFEEMGQHKKLANAILSSEGDGMVKAWEELYKVSSLLRTDIPTLNFFRNLDDSPALQTKLLNDLDDIAKTKFVDDFADAPDAALAKLDNDLAIVDDWKITKNINPVAGGSSPLPKRGNSKNVNLNSNGDPATAGDWDNFYENEAGDILAQKGYDIEQSPSASGRTDVEPPYFNPTPTSNPDFKMNRDNSLFFDAFSPRLGTNVRNVHDRAVQKLRSGQAKSFVINLGQWGGSIDDLLKQFRHWPEPGMRQVIIIDAQKNVLNILQ